MPGAMGGGGGGGSPISVETVTGALTDPVGTTTGALDTAVTTAGEGIGVGADVVGDNLQTAVENNPISGTEGLGMNEGMATTLGDVGGMINEGITTGAAATKDALGAVAEATHVNLETGANATKEALAAAADAAHVNLETGANATKEALAAIAEATKTNLEYGAGYVEDFRDKVLDTFINNPLEQIMGVFDDKVSDAAGDTGETEEEKAIRIASGQDTFAKGNIGKKKKNNPFLAINKGKKSARGSTKFKKLPSATSTLRI